MLQENMKSMRDRETAIIGACRALLMRHDKVSLSDFGGPMQEWARTVLRGMGFREQILNQKLTNDFVKEIFLAGISSIVFIEEQLIGTTQQ